MNHRHPVPPHDCGHASRTACLAEFGRMRQEISCLQAQNQACRRVAAMCEHELQAFMTAFDNSPIPQSWYDRDGKFLRASKAGLMPHIRESVPAEYSIFNEPVLIMLGIPALFKRALQGETVRMPRYRFNPSSMSLNAPDRDYVLETVMLPVTGSDGQVTSVIVQHYDLTALDQAEREIRRLLGLAAPRE